VCQGDILQIHFALANYSTEDINVTANLWFSSDPNWDTGDKVSPTAQTFSVDAAHSKHKFYGFEVPVLDVGKLYPIVRVTATTPSGVTVKDSIPLRGQVTSPTLCFHV